MDNSKLIYLILVSVFRMCFCQLPTDGQCFRNKSMSVSGVSISVKTIFCCRNFEPIGTSNECKGCEFGYTSDGSKCQPCHSGKYGEKCGKKCNCHITERCHHKLGCTPHEKGNIVSGTENNNVIIFMISIAGIGIIVLIIWTVWRCRFNFLHFKKIQRRRKLIEGRTKLSNGLPIEAVVEMEETN